MSGITQPLVSIIVPVYNTEKYLRKCVDSLINQTYNDVEIILVDDGSTDSSGVICDELCAQDERIKVIHKPNGGSSSSRESGIDAACGDYIMIIDSDDWLDLETVDVCVERASNTGADCVMFSYVKEYPDNSIPMHVMDGDMSLVGYEAEDKVYRRLFGLCDDELAHPERVENIVSCCMKLYKAEFAKKGRFFDTKEVGSSEDALFNMYALHGAKKIEYIDKPYYHYLKNPASITNTYRPRLVAQWGRLFEIMESVIEEKELGERYRTALSNRIALSIIGIGMNELSAPDVSFAGHVRNLNKYLKSDKYREAVKNIPIKPMPLIWKVFVLCCKLHAGFAVYMMLRAIQYLRKRA